MATASIPEPTLVFYKSSMCKHCQNLTNIWDSVKHALKGVHPGLRFYEVTATDNTGKFNENIVPKDLLRYGRWFPMILLIPGRTWDDAMANLGPKNPVEIREGVQIMNAKWEDRNFRYNQEYDIRNPAEFSKWLREALNNSEFKRVQNGESVVSTPVVRPVQRVEPVTPAPRPIAPLMSNIVRPIHTVSSRRESVVEVEGDVCRMKIISRPR